MLALVLSGANCRQSLVNPGWLQVDPDAHGNPKAGRSIRRSHATG